MKILSLIVAMLGVFIAYLMWGPLLHWLWAQFPPTTVAWYGIWKIGCLILVGYFGGVAIPLVCLIFAIGLFIESL